MLKIKKYLDQKYKLNIINYPSFGIIKKFSSINYLTGHRNSDLNKNNYVNISRIDKPLDIKIDNDKKLEIENINIIDNIIKIKKNNSNRYIILDNNGKIDFITNPINNDNTFFKLITNSDDSISLLNVKYNKFLRIKDDQTLDSLNIIVKDNKIPHNRDNFDIKFKLLNNDSSLVKGDLIKINENKYIKTDDNVIPFSYLKGSINTKINFRTPLIKNNWTIVSVTRYDPMVLNMLIKY